MVKRIAALFFLLSGIFAAAQAQTAPECRNLIGIYTAPDPTEATSQALSNYNGDPGVITAYVVLTDPCNTALAQPMAVLGGFEFRIVVSGGAIILDAALPPLSFNFHPEPNNWLVGTNIPVVDGCAVLLTLTVGGMTGEQAEFHLTPLPRYASLPGSLAIADYADEFSLSAAGPSSGDFTLPVFGLYTGDAVRQTGCAVTTWHVATNGDDAWPGTSAQPFLTVARGLLAAATGDTVQIETGTYSGEGNRGLDFQGKGIVLRGATGDPADVVIDCGPGSTGDFGFRFASGEDSTAVLAAITLDPGERDGIRCEGASPRITDCVVTGTNGIALYCNGASPVVTGTDFVANNSGSDGGTVELRNGSSPRLVDCGIIDNFGKDSGFKDVRGFVGGSINCSGGSNPLLVRCLIAENHNLDGSGAGMSCVDSSPTLVECTFRNNRIDRTGAAVLYGSAVDCYGSSPLLVRCLFVGNGNDYPALGRGVVAGRGTSSLVLDQCTFAGNDAVSCVLYVSESDLTVSRTIVAANGAPAFASVLPGQLVVTDTDIHGNTGGDWIEAFAVLAGTAGNLWGDPLFCDPGAGDYGIRANSPCAGSLLHERIGAFDVACDGLPGPVLLGVADVPEDQGYQVRVSWCRSGYDEAGSPFPIVGYDVYRRADPAAAVTDGRKLLGWDYLLRVPAGGDQIYQTVVPTLCNDAADGTPCPSEFLVSAATADLLVHFDSLPASGSSVDNLAPAVPQHLAVEYAALGNRISWAPPGDPDVAQYEVWRTDGPAPGEDPGEPTATTTGTQWVDSTFVGSAWDHAYWVAAVDGAGNRGPLTQWDSANLAAIGKEGLPRAVTLHGNAPNPFNPMTTLRFDLPRSSQVTLGIYDLAGRLVRSLISGTSLEAGSHERVWDGRNDAGLSVSSGIYLYRLHAGDFTETKRMTLVR